MTLRERFMAKVEISDGCWPWLGSKTAKGYGRIQTGLRSPAGHYAPVPAHRVAYELFIGPIPEGLHVDHLCKNPGCVNPAHLEPVTNRENVERWHSVQCRNGHARTPENTWVSPSS